MRKKLILESTAHLKNVVCHDSGSYIISNATFPSYFLKDEKSVITGHAKLDLAIFTKIAKSLNITVRYVGEEPNSLVTGIYNQLMAESLPHTGIECRIIPRKVCNGDVISASSARAAIRNGRLDILKQLVPETTYHYFTSTQAEPILERIQAADNVLHY